MSKWVVIWVCYFTMSVTASVLLVTFEEALSLLATIGTAGTIALTGLLLLVATPAHLLALLGEDSDGSDVQVSGEGD